LLSIAKKSKTDADDDGNELLDKNGQRIYSDVLFAVPGDVIYYLGYHVLLVQSVEYGDG